MIVISLLVLLSAMLAFVFVVGRYNKTNNKYVERKEQDQRKHNPIREQKWWMK